MMQQYRETAEQFFRQIEEGCLEAPSNSPVRGRDSAIDIQRKYACLSRILKRAVEQQLANCKLSFAGLFARISYLVRERNVPESLARQINETRLHLAPNYTLTEKDFPYDLKAVVQFIAAIYDVSLLSLKGTGGSVFFPAQDRKVGWNKYDVSSLRVIVNSWDADYIYVTESLNATGLKVCYTAANKFLTLEGRTNADYLRTILFVDCQLNLVHPRFSPLPTSSFRGGDNGSGNTSPLKGESEGTCYPELIILEPDYLIDISTIASCFETYATSPYVQLLNKFRTTTITQPILLGNFASQFLDETVRGEKRTYAESAKEYFRHNALSMAVTDVDNTFHTNAQRQKSIIQKLIGEDLPQEVSTYNADDVTLEPSFFCERLGLQGRMDFLCPTHTLPFREGERTPSDSPVRGRDDFSDIIIIEQKSGKGQWGSADPQCPIQQEKHYVQLLLYRALMQYGFDIPAEKLQNLFLLYSKYEKGLLRMGPAPELLHRAIDVRNQLAWCEMGYTEVALSILDRLTPEKLNRNKIHGRLWDDYVRKQILEVLMPFQKASPLEKKYFLRMMQFLEMEHLLEKTGNRTKENSGFASRWHDTLEEKKEAGNIIDGLVPQVPGGDDSLDDCMEYIDLTSPSGAWGASPNFREGDIVILYPYELGSEPDCCKQMVFRASIVSLRPDRVTLRLRNTQTNRKLFVKPAGCRWAIEHDLLESSMSSQYRAMQLLLNAPKHRRDLLLLQRKPQVDTSIKLKGDYGEFNELQLRAKQAKDFFIVIGPPGTGKTSYGMLNLVQEELLEEGSSILITSYTNRAVDEICSKLVETDTDFLRIGSPLSCAPEYHDYLLSQKISDCRKSDEVKTLVQAARIICATTSTLNGHPEIFQLKSFTLCIIDEASQILEPQLVGLLSVCHGEDVAIGKFVMIGDHKQLPAVVQQTEEQSHVDDEDLQKIHLTDCRRSLFERLLENIKRTQSRKAAKDDFQFSISNSQFVFMLTRQGRMHRRIAEFPNREFYGGKLDVVPLPHQIIPGYEPVSFINVEPENDGTSDKVNTKEAEVIAEQVLYYCNKYKDTFDPTQTIGVIVPYRNQITAVRNAIQAKHPVSNTQHPITIDTVERFQGSQRDVIIYGFTVKKPYQLNFLCSNTFEEDGMLIDRRLNVAMTRARRHLILVGNADILRINVTFRRLLDFVKETTKSVR